MLVRMRKISSLTLQQNFMRDILNAVKRIFPFIYLFIIYTNRKKRGKERLNFQLKYIYWRNFIFFFFFFYLKKKGYVFIRETLYT